MGLKDFFVKQGFITADSGDKTNTTTTTNKQDSDNVAPTFFPVTNVSNNSTSSDPAFVTPLQQTRNDQTQIDPSFIKFFEDELVKANLPGPDYFEFRQLLNKTQQKMASKGLASDEVVLQTVLMSFEAQDITRPKLIEAARKYKDIIKAKNDEFIRGAEAEKTNQLQKRQSVLQTHDANIQNMMQQLQQLEQQKQQLTDALNKEKTQSEVDKSMGKEGIAKIERAEQLIALAHNYIQGTIDADIQRLNSV